MLLFSTFLLQWLLIIITFEPDPASGVSVRPYMLVLGIAQDGGHPHAGCLLDCCVSVWEGEREGHLVSCLALVDPSARESWLFDATPDFPEQLHRLEERTQTSLKGIFLTHAHIGHYSGLIHLGREVMGAKNFPVFTMPRMKEFLENNGPWSQLVDLGNISIRSLKEEAAVELRAGIRVTPFRVPHRDEYSETVGYRIDGPSKSAIFIPDIDKWHLWEQDIASLISRVDYAFLDGTFYQDGELEGRSMSEIPHPFVEESMKLLEGLPVSVRQKVYFIHLNHSNPLLVEDGEASREVLRRGFHVGKEGSWFGL